MADIPHDFSYDAISGVPSQKNSGPYMIDIRNLNFSYNNEKKHYKKIWI